MAVDPYATPLAEVARELRTGTRTPVGFLDDLWTRVDEIDPEVQAFVAEDGRRDRATAEAAAVEHGTSEQHHPLYGVPVGVKDIFNVRGLLTGGGSAVPSSVLTGPEAPVVTRLRDAGAYVMGKTVTTEFAYAAPGPTRNPHALEHTPGGSSSGSAAGVAAGLFPLAIGSQTGGSVLRPAAFCGVVGFKPTFGRIPTTGVLPLSSSLDTVGLFTQDVRGMRIAAAATCDGWDDELEPASEPTLGVPAAAYLDQASSVGREAFEEQVESLSASGYTVRRTDLFDEADRISDHHQTLMAAETALAHYEWFETYGDQYHEQTADFIATGREVSIESLSQVRSDQTARRETVRETMAHNEIDVWVSPAAPGPAPSGIDSTGSSIMNRFWTYVGVPAVSVPAGTTEEGLPLGLQCTAATGADERLLGWAGELRRAVA